MRRRRRSHRRLFKKIKKLACLGASLFLFAWGTKSCDKKFEDATIITDRLTAQDGGYLDDNVTYADLMAAIDENEHITNKCNVKTYLQNYVTNLDQKKPRLDKSILKRNIELLKISYCSKKEMAETSNNNYAYTSFEPKYHSLIVRHDCEIEDYIYNSFSYMTRVLYDNRKKDNVIINTSFDDNGYGKAIGDEINKTFTNEVLWDFTSYKMDNITLLEKVIPMDQLYNIYFDGDVYTLQDKLVDINKKLDEKKFINATDKQNKLLFDDKKQNDHNADKEVYNYLIDYYSSIPYPKFIDNYKVFYQLVDSLDTKDDIRNDLTKQLKKAKNK